MKVTKVTNQTMTLAQIEFCDQLERSDRSGQAVWDPRVATEPAPDCVVFLQEIGRFAVMFPPGRYCVEDDDWYRHDEGGVMTPVPDLIEEAWRAGKEVRTVLKEALNIGAYVISVVVFTDMEPDAGIMEAAQGRGVRVFFGQDELVERLVNLPDEEQLQPQLGGRYISKEVAALSRSSAPRALAPELELGDGRLVIQHVDVVNVYVTGASSDGGGNSLSIPKALVPGLELGDGQLVIQHVDVVNVYVTGVSSDGDDDSPSTVQGR